MIKFIKCPDGGSAVKKDCLAGKCRLGRRCAPVTYLQLVCREREWKGIPSVTQLLQGTREAYLKITSDFTADPQQATFRVLGTRGHTALEIDNDFSFTEEHFSGDNLQGTADLLEKQENGEWWLIDHKTAGSFKVAKAIGLVKMEEVLKDADGNPLKHKNGKPKKKVWWEVTPESLKAREADIHDWIYQLNAYRIEMEEQLKEKISRLWIFAVVRDGGTFSATNRGLTENFYYIPIPIIDDDIIKAYFSTKRNLLIHALNTKTVPPECSADECWNGRKCQLCEVASVCATYGRSYLTIDEVEDGQS